METHVDQKQEKGVVFLQGKKTRLRPLSMSDLQRVTRWINDPEVRSFVSSSFPMREHQEEEWLKRVDPTNTNVTLAIETLDGKHIGNMGIHKIDWVHRTCTTGAIIGEKEFWGKGYGTDAKMCLLEYIFNTLGLHKVCSDVIAYNKRSLNYSLHCGYKIEGTRKKHIFKNGKYADLIELGLFKKDWLPIWRKYQKTGKIK